MSATGPAELNETEPGTYEVTLTGATGTVILTASSLETANYGAGEVSTSFLISDPGKEDQTISFSPIEDKVYGDAAFDLEGSSSSGLSIAYSVVSGPVSITGSTVSIEGAGEVVIAANQEGNEEYNPAAEVTQSFTIAKAPQEIDFKEIGEVFLNEEKVTLEASVTSELLITFTSSNTQMASIAGTSTLILHQAGIVTITATQAGDKNFLSASRSIDVVILESLGLLTEELSVYPNPTSEFINLDFGDLEPKGSYKLWSLSGNVQMQGILSDQINIKELAPGTHILWVSYDETKAATRIVIE
ncbi:MAG: T9SS type A sorting domain-containing protein [Marinoscillum sp.]